MENSYRIQLVVEFLFQAFPQVIIQAINNNMLMDPKSAETNNGVVTKGVDNAVTDDSASGKAAEPTNNPTASEGWTNLMYISIIFSILVFVKNVTTWTIFIIRRYIEQREDVALRP